STSKTPSYTKSVSWQHHPQSLITSLLIVFQTNNRTPFSHFKKHKHC
ncbi:transposase, partial [Shigella boydii]